LKNVKKLVQDVDDKINPLMSNIVSSSKAAERALLQIEKAFSTKEGFFSELETSFKQTSKTARVALRQIQTTLSNLEDMTEEGSPLRYELHNVLKELSAAVRSIRVLTDYIERHPESLLRGKPNSGGK
ncbi:unnamed protein product, partial [marine sediment metagenome]